MRKNCLLRNVNLDFDTQVSCVCLCNKVSFEMGSRVKQALLGVPTLTAKTVPLTALVTF